MASPGSLFVPTANPRQQDIPVGQNPDRRCVYRAMDQWFFAFAIGVVVQGVQGLTKSSTDGENVIHRKNDPPFFE